MADKISEVTHRTSTYVHTISKTQIGMQTLAILSFTVEMSDLRTHHTRTVASLENKLDALQ